MRMSKNLILHLVLAMLFSYFNDSASTASAQTHFERGLKLYIANDMIQALVEFNSALKSEPCDDAVLHARANVYSEMHDYKSAVRDYSKAIDINPKNGLLYANRAWAYKHLGQHDLASKDFERCSQLLKSKPIDAELYKKQNQIYVSK